MGVTRWSGFAATCGCATTLRCGRRSSATIAWSRSSASTTGCCAAATRPAPARSSCSSAWASSGRGSRPAGAGSGSGEEPARARAGRAGAVETGCAEVHFADDVSPFARRRGERTAKAFRGAGLGGLRPSRGSTPSMCARSRPGPAGPTASSRPSTGTGWRSSGARCCEAPRRVPVPPKPRAGRLPKLADLGLDPGGRRAGAGRGAGGAPAPRRVPASVTSAPTPMATMRSARTGCRGFRPTCTSARPLAGQVEERLPRRAGRRGVPPPALLARFPPSRPLPLSAQRALGVPAAATAEWRGAARAGRSRRGRRVAPAFRWWTRACASSGWRGGCTTGRAWSPGRF